MQQDKQSLSGSGLPEKLLLVCLGILFLYLICQIPLFQYGRDQGIYSVIGREVLQGGAPYRDAWDFKPPAIYFIYALSRSLFGNSMHAVRIFESLSYLSLLYAFIIFSRRFFSAWQVGMLGGTLALLSHVQLDFWHTGQPESFGAVFLIWALVSATYIPQQGSARALIKQIISWALSGALFTVAALLKPPLGGAFIFSLGILIYKHIHGADGSLWIRRAAALTVAYVCGSALVLLTFFLFLLTKNALSDFYNIFFQFVPHYTGLDLSLQKLPQLIAYTSKQWLLKFSLLTTMGMFLVLLLPPLAIKENEGCLHILGVLIPQLLGVALQAKNFPYHFGAILPFSALLGAAGLWKVWKRTRGRWLFLCVILFVLYWHMDHNNMVQKGFLRYKALANTAQRAAINDMLHTTNDVNARTNRLTAAWLRQNVPAGSPIYIWGFETVIYDLSDRPLSTKYIYNIPQRVAWNKHAARKALMQDLYKSPPAAIIVARNDRMSWVTGNRQDSAEELKTFHGLATLLMKRYIYTVSFEDLDIYLHKSLHPDQGINP